jgi:hypothetical protein
VLALHALDALDRDLGLRLAVELDLVVREAQLVGDLRDRAGLDAAGDLEVGREGHQAKPPAW